MRILIAEDERITSRTLQRQLEGWGHDVVTAEDGAEAWDKFQQQAFDIVVTDWEMPRMDGRKLVERIRCGPQTWYTYLIMLTARSEKADLVTGMEAGADDFLAKPFDRNELRVRLNAGERIIQLERMLAAQNEELHRANERMKRDLDCAADVQRELLPQELPDRLGANFAWHFEPCDELGGDILNVLPLNAHTVAVYLLDVSGHGVPAALLSVTLSRVLTTSDAGSSILMTRSTNADVARVTPPRDVVGQLNRRFPMTGRHGKYFTMAYAVLDTNTRLLHYTIAGHPPPIIVRPDCPPQQLTGRNLPIGVAHDARFEDWSIQLEPGDRLYIYSDGITEARNDKDEMLAMEGLVRLIGSNQSSSLQQALKGLIEELKRWCNLVPLEDDVSVLSLELPKAD